MWPAAYPGEVAATAKSQPLVRVRSIGLDGVRAQRGLAMTAHNVRLLCRCPVCGKLGDEQSMVKVGPMKTPALHVRAARRRHCESPARGAGEVQLGGGRA